MVNRPASNDSNDDLSLRLRPVLSSLNVNLSSELNRYRRNRLTREAHADDVFSDLEEATFDVNVSDINVSASSANIPSPPPVPPNRRIDSSLSQIKVADSSAQALVQRSHSTVGERLGNSSTTAPDNRPGGSIVNITATQADTASAQAFDPTEYPNGYLASSEKLIESLDDLPPMPEPVNIAPPKPRRKTVSLLAGAILGLLGLIAGLGVSYVVSSPAMMQKLANIFEGEDEAVVAEAENTFDPPGPDLSEREFVDLELDNLSSLEMTPEPLNPANNPDQALPGLPPTSAQLPPIEGQSPATTGEIQAAIVPAGVTYYVTVPFAAEQDLTNVRQTVEEAFVRSFSDGNRIQIAAFDNPTDAQTFVADIKNQGITAFVYGPTTE